MQQVKTFRRPLLMLGFMTFTIGILWSVNSDPAPITNQEVVIEPTKIEIQGEQASIWKKFLPTSAIEKRNVARANRQLELAGMIKNLNGIARATVAISNEQQRGIGTAHIPMTACVTLQPSEGTVFKPTTIQAVRLLVANATSGLDIDDVTIINSLSGAVCECEDVYAVLPLDLQAIQHEVEDAIGLPVATIAVRLVRPEAGLAPVPWRANAQPLIQVTLPESWVAKRAGQVGSATTALMMVENYIHQTIPGVAITIDVIKDPVLSKTVEPTTEFYAKQLVVVVGLLSLFTMTILVNRRNAGSNGIESSQSVTPKEEAFMIVEMEHHHACKAIDALHGARKIAVLQAIVSLETYDETPMVHVQAQQSFSLSSAH